MRITYNFFFFVTLKLTPFPPSSEKFIVYILTGNLQSFLVCFKLYLTVTFFFFAKLPQSEMPTTLLPIQVSMFLHMQDTGLGAVGNPLIIVELHKF